MLYLIHEVEHDCCNQKSKKVLQNVKNLNNQLIGTWKIEN